MILVQDEQNVISSHNTVREAYRAAVPEHALLPSESNDWHVRMLWSTFEQLQATGYVCVCHSASANVAYFLKNDGPLPPVLE